MKNLCAVLVLWSVLVIGVHAAPTTTTKAAVETKVETSAETTTPEQNVAVVQVKTLMNKMIAYLESFRMRQLAYFTELKEKHKDVVAETTIKDITTIMAPDVSSSTTEEADVSAEESNEQTIEYLRYGYAWAGEGFFSHRALYYVVVILCTLFIVRFIFSRFSR